MSEHQPTNIYFHQAQIFPTSASAEAAKSPTTLCLPCLNRMILRQVSSLGGRRSLASLEQAHNKYSFYRSTSVSAGAEMERSINLSGATTRTDNLNYIRTLRSVSAAVGQEHNSAASSTKGHKSSLNTSEARKTRVMYFWSEQLWMPHIIHTAGANPWYTSLLFTSTAEKLHMKLTMPFIPA